MANGVLRETVRCGFGGNIQRGPVRALPTRGTFWSPFLPWTLLSQLKMNDFDVGYEVLECCKSAFISRNFHSDYVHNMTKLVG